MTVDEARWYLAGMFDGEGWVHFSPKNLSRDAGIANTDLDILATVTSCMDILEIPYRFVEVSLKGSIGKKRCYEVQITKREGFISLYEKVPLRSKRKKETLESLLMSYTRSPYTAVQSP